MSKINELKLKIEARIKRLEERKEMGRGECVELQFLKSMLKGIKGVQ